MTTAPDFLEEARAYVRGPVSWIDDSYAAHEDTYLAGASRGYEVGKGDALAHHEATDKAWSKTLAERDQLKQQLAEREETNRQVTTALVQAEAEIERLKTEVEAQARLNGMGAERELKLKAEVDRLTTAFQVTTVGLMLAEQALRQERERNARLVEAFKKIQRLALSGLDMSQTKFNAFVTERALKIADQALQSAAKLDEGNG